MKYIRFVLLVCCILIFVPLPAVGLSGDNKQGTGTGIVERIKMTNQYKCSYEGKTVKITISTGDGLEGVILVHDGTDFAVIEDICGPSVITKYDGNGRQIYRIEDGVHAHSTGILSLKRGLLYIFHFEDREIHGKSIRVYSWKTAKRVKTIPVNETPVSMRLDDAGGYLYLKDNEKNEEKIKL